MFTKKPNRKDTLLEKAINDLHTQMAGELGDSDEYASMVAQLVKLYELREHDAPRRVSPDTLVLAATNLAGIAMIIAYEHAHVITSKATNFVMKLR